ncbi:MAG: hypothetical protein V4613_05610 [Bacteroidota bacterium]
MNKIKFLIVALVIAATSISLSSCQKGSDDPAVSLKTRQDRFTNTWTLIKYEKNGTTQDLSGATYTYTTFNDGTLSRTVEGTVFGYPTRTVSSGNWAFLNEDEDVKITINNNVTIYNVQRLASKELWLKEVNNADTYIYYFEGL